VLKKLVPVVFEIDENTKVVVGEAVIGENGAWVAKINNDGQLVAYITGAVGSEFSFELPEITYQSK
jgi:hypothetical protein